MHRIDTKASLKYKLAALLLVSASVVKADWMSDLQDTKNYADNYLDTKVDNYKD
jgi:hypothetical protein